ncbi:MAG: Gp15 family bacteriophage protein [Oscillospiraceae bacterium]
MRLLDNELPSEYVTADGIAVPFRTDYRTWMQFENLMLDKDLPDNVKPLLAKSLIFLKPIKEDVNTFLLWFYRGGKPPRDDAEKKKKKSKSMRAYSFEYDEELIYAAFMQCYGIDLCETDMHWWKFKALFDGLSEDTKLHRVMGYRAMELDRNKTDERTKQYRELKELYKLPKYLSEEQKIAELKRILHEDK